MKRWFLATLTVLLATVALARSEGIYNPSSNAVGDYQGIDSNKPASGSTLACSYSPVTTGTQSVAYTGATPAASGGTPAYTFSETGALPTGLTINTTNGVISGTPSVSGTFAGIQVAVTDSLSAAANCGASFTLVIAPAVTPSYSARSGISASGTGAVLTGSIDIGAAAADRVVIVGFTCQNGPAVTSVVVNGVTLSNALTNVISTPGAYLYSGLVISGSGSQTVTITFASGSFLTRTAFIWIANGLSSNSPKNVSNTPVTTSPALINASAGDLLFAVTGQTTAGTPNYTGNSTENPFSSRAVLSGINSGFYGDWTVISSNASFSINDSVSAERVAVTFR